MELRWLLDRIWLLPSGRACTWPGGAVLTLRHRRAEDPIVRQQLKWLSNGALFGVLPFLLFYVLPYSLGVVPGPYMKMAVLSLGLVPLTWAYAVLRYRLMDVDVIFQQGYVYTLATLAILGLFYGLIFSLGKFEDLSPAAAFLLILIAAFAFQPIRGWIQVQLDKYYFYKDRYDYRRTLIEFARELSSETDMDAMLASVADRMRRTLSVPRVAFFLLDEGEQRFQLQAAFGSTERRGKRPGEEPGPEFPAGRSRRPLPVLRAAAPPAGRSLAALARCGAQDHRRPGSDLLRALRGAGQDHRLHRRQPHRQGRLPAQRRCGDAGDAGGLRGDRRREHAPVPLPADARWKRTSGSRNSRKTSSSPSTSASWPPTWPTAWRAGTRRWSG